MLSLTGAFLLKSGLAIQTGLKCDKNNGTKGHFTVDVNRGLSDFVSPEEFLSTKKKLRFENRFFHNIQNRYLLNSKYYHRSVNVLY